LELCPASEVNDGPCPEKPDHHRGCTSGGWHCKGWAAPFSMFESYLNHTN